MRPIIVTQTGAGSSKVIPFDLFRNPFNVGIGCVVSGTVNYTVQHSFDDPQFPASMTWFPHDDALLVAATTNQNSNYAYPVQATRVTVNSGTGSVTVTYIQAGLLGG